MGKRAHKYQRRPSAELYKTETRREKELLPHQTRPLEVVGITGSNMEPLITEHRCHCGLQGVHTLQVEGFLDAHLCNRHFSHLRQYLGVEKHLAEQEREDQPMFEKKSAKPLANPWLERVTAIEDAHIAGYEEFLKRKERRDKLVAEYREASRKRKAPELADDLETIIAAQTRNVAIDDGVPKVLNEAELLMRTAQRDWADPLHNELCQEFKLIEAEHEARQAKAAAEYAEKVAASWRDREAAAVRAQAISLERAQALGYFERRDYEKYLRSLDQPQPEAVSLPPKPKTLDRLLAGYGQQSA